MTRHTSPSLFPVLVLGLATSLAHPLLAQLELQRIRVKDQRSFGAFGSSVAVSGNLLAVGARDERLTANYMGAVYLFRKGSHGWVREAKLTAPVPAVHDRFGTSVALSGDQLVVGAPAYISKTTGGKIHIFRKKAGKWVHEAEFARGRWFGASVALSGNRVLAGAPGTRHRKVAWGGNNYAGAAWVFKFDGTSWLEEAKLLASDPAYGDHFGSAVSIQGNSLLVGASGEGDDSLRRFAIGSVYAFDWNGQSWVESQKFRALKSADQSFFGAAISWDGNDAVIGSPGKKANGVWGAGAAYLFHKGTAGWSQQQKWTSPWPSTSAAFGSRVALSSGLAVIGHNGRDAEGNKRGAIHVWRRTSSNKWIPEPAFQGSGLVGKYSSFGNSVALDGSTLAAGGYLEDNKPLSDGAVWLYDMSPDFHLMVLPLPLVIKDSAKFEVRHAPKNAIAFLMFGFQGTTHFPLPWPRATLRLVNPMILGTLPTGTKGSALWEFNIPAAALGVKLWAQVFELESLTRARTSNVIYSKIRLPL